MPCPYCESKGHREICDVFRPCGDNNQLRLTATGTGHIVLRKDRVKIASWDKTHET
jgi:hypothetical protein